MEDASRERLLEQLDVYRGVLHHYRYPVLRVRQKPALDIFSDSEIEALSATLEKFGQHPASALVDLTHEHRAYKRADADRPSGSSVDLPYEYFFEDASPEFHSVRDLAAEEQEDRDFANAFQSAGRAALAQKRKATARLD